MSSHSISVQGGVISDTFQAVAVYRDVILAVSDIGRPPGVPTRGHGRASGHEMFAQRGIRPLPGYADTFAMVWSWFSGLLHHKQVVAPETAAGTPHGTKQRSRGGAALLMVVFVVALLATAVSGIIQLNTEEVQVMRNHLGLVQAHAIAEAGIEDAIAHKRMDPSWHQGIHRRFGGGDYSVTVAGETLTSIGRFAGGYQTKLSVDITILGEKTPYHVRVDAVRLNQ